MHKCPRAVPSIGASPSFRVCQSPPENVGEEPEAAPMAAHGGSAPAAVLACVPLARPHTERDFAHRVRYLNNFSRKWSTFEALVNTVLWWKLLGEELWQGVRAPLGELTGNWCSNRLKDHNLLCTDPDCACGYTAQVPSAPSGTVLGKSTAANSS